MRIKGLTTKPNRWYATYKSDPPEREDDSYYIILHEDSDQHGHVPFATSVLFGLQTAVAKYGEDEADSNVTTDTILSKPLNASAVPWTPKLLLPSSNSHTESGVYQVKRQNVIIGLSTLQKISPKF
jgi:hypothetical protein